MQASKKVFARAIEAKLEFDLNLAERLFNSWSCQKCSTALIGCEFTRKVQKFVAFCSAKVC